MEPKGNNQTARRRSSKELGVFARVEGIGSLPARMVRKVQSLCAPGPPAGPPPGLEGIPLPPETPEQESTRLKASAEHAKMWQRRMRRLSGPPGIEQVKLQCIEVHRPRPIELALVANPPSGGFRRVAKSVCHI